MHCRCMNLDGECPNNHFADCECNPIAMQQTQKPWIEEFDSKFAFVMEWIKRNCKDEVIAGVDMNHIDTILKTFIALVESRTRADALREASEKMIDGLNPLWLAKAFHDYYEITAKLKGWKTQKDCQVDFEDLPKENQETMICTAGKVLHEMQCQFGKTAKVIEALGNKK